MQISITHSFRRCSKSPREEGIGPDILLFEISLEEIID